MPMFAPWRERRLIGAELRPQLHVDVPTFDYRGNVRRLTDARLWPESTRQISELRLSVAYESASFLGRTFGRGCLDLDIVDNRYLSEREIHSRIANFFTTYGLA